MRGELMVFSSPMGRSSMTDCIDKLRASNIRLAHPVTETVVLLTDEGRVETGERQAREELVATRPVNVKFWLDSDTDVIMTARSIPGLDVLEFDLDGLDVGEVNHVAAAVLWYAVTDARTIGMIVDSQLPDTTDHWEEYFTTGKEGPRRIPEFFWKRTGRTHFLVDVSESAFFLPASDPSREHDR